MEDRSDAGDGFNGASSSSGTASGGAIGPVPAPPRKRNTPDGTADISPASSNIAGDGNGALRPAPDPLRKPSVSDVTEDTSDVPSASSGLLHKKSEEKSKRVPLTVQPKATWWSRLVANTWTFEALAMLFSIACLIAIAVVLRVYENKPTHPMQYGITLNAIIATLATGSKSALLCVIAGSLGQIKWNLFQTQRSRKLYDLQALDDASRGPAGAIGLLLERPKGALSVLGAGITILALIFDPFVQQIIRYPTRSNTAPDEIATTRRAYGFAADAVSTELMSAFNAGLWADSTEFMRSPTCSSGDCEFPRFSSLEWCSKCEDITASMKLKGTCSHSGAGWINGTCTISAGMDDEAVVVQGTPGVLEGQLVQDLNLTSDIVWATSELTIPFVVAAWNWHPTRRYNVTIAGVQGPVAAFAHASLIYNSTAIDGRLDFGTKIGSAEHCVLTPCLKHYNVKTSKGLVNAQVEATNYGITQFITLRNPLGGLEYESCWQPSPGNVTYTYTGTITYPAYSWLSNVRSDQYTYENRSSPAFCPVSVYGQVAAQYLTGATTSNYGWRHDGTGLITTKPPANSSDSIRQVAKHNLSYVMNNIASSLSRLALDVSGETVTGTVHVSETYVLVRWEWLVLPIILVVAGLILFLTTILLTTLHHNNLWRCSLLPLLYHNLEISAATDQFAPADVARMELDARKIDARLDVTKEHGGTSFHQKP